MSTPQGLSQLGGTAGHERGAGGLTPSPPARPESWTAAITQSHGRQPSHTESWTAVNTLRRNPHSPKHITVQVQTRGGRCTLVIGGDTRIGFRDGAQLRSSPDS